MVCNKIVINPEEVQAYQQEPVCIVLIFWGFFSSPNFCCAAASLIALAKTTIVVVATRLTISASTKARPW